MIIYPGNNTGHLMESLYNQYGNLVHVGRINTGKWLWECYEAGIDSIDGTGWFRKKRQYHQLSDFLAYQAGLHPRYFQLSLPLTND